MKLHNAVQDQPIVSNVGEIGEFRIRNSAKAFNILSSGLYANKIRAIIRELSCNAIDSQIAAGRGNTPFDVHLPNQLEPHFSIRDYGTGLNHDQVINIYTTYFESTKTSSNEFIGALGLGSKSPFSYTDNFTVTAIQNNKKGIYTAFINDQGIPSIALMMEEETTEPNGVEVKFAVIDKYDYSKFREEARNVYKYFKQRPVISGADNFQFDELQYETKDIIPGVHQGTGRNSIAIMGNIAYPIQIPEADQTLGDLRRLLECNLIMEFNIGELDFQASREGLSYIPETISAIKNKLEKLNAQLAIHIATEADKITNVWEKTLYLASKGSNYGLWTSAVDLYVQNTKFEYYKVKNGYDRTHVFNLDVQKLETECNIVIRCFNKSKHYNSVSNVKNKHTYETVNGNNVGKYYWDIRISKDNRFVINDTRVGCFERAKYHIKTTSYMTDQSLNNVYVYTIEPCDKTKPINIEGFKKLLCNPPESYFLLASNLAQKDRVAKMGKNVTIMRLEERGSGGYTRREEMVWRDAGKISDFADSKTYYYIPLAGFKALNNCPEVKSLYTHLRRSGVHNGDVYGVRKTDIEYVKTQKNWVELDRFIIEKLSKIGVTEIMGMVKQALDIKDLISYNNGNVNQNSPFVKLVNTFKDIKSIDTRVQQSTQWLCKEYDVKTNTNPQTLIDKYTQEVMAVKNRYPLLQHLSSYCVDKTAIAEYINLIDQSKGV